MMTQPKTLVLIDSLYEQYGLDGAERDGILFLPMLKGQWTGRAIRAARKAHLSLDLPGRTLWLGDWTRAAGDYDTIVLADAGNTPNVVRYLKQRYPRKRVIVWYRNPVAATLSPDVLDQSACEVWSFDPADCAAYGMWYNPQFYIPRDPGGPQAIRQDVFFVGQDKGRGPLLAQMERALQKAGCRTRFCVVGVNSPRLSYREIVAEIAASRVVVDCPCAGQAGLTLRPLEALFYRKKLLTTSPDIKTRDFYHPGWVFVWGQDDPGALGEFLARPWQGPDEACRDAYGLKAWVDRFAT